VVEEEQRVAGGDPPLDLGVEAQIDVGVSAYEDGGLREEERVARTGAADDGDPRSHLRAGSGEAFRTPRRRSGRRERGTVGMSVRDELAIAIEEGPVPGTIGSELHGSLEPGDGTHGIAEREERAADDVGSKRSLF